MIPVSLHSAMSCGDLGDDKRDILLHAEMARVVDDDCASLCRMWHKLGADAAAGAEKRELDVVLCKDAWRELDNGNLAVVERNALAETAAACERNELFDGEVLLF